jgi:hypothetical protein
MNKLNAGPLGPAVNRSTTRSHIPSNCKLRPT